ncbi:MAG: site-specific integrase, partial [Aestuariivirgaceae bacterium]|nr:site-specific integrase [Aestuariivirgaceae bacterium]
MTASSSDRLIGQFLEMMSAERGAAGNTLAAYERDLRDYGTFLGGRMAQAGADDIRAFLVHLEAQGMARATSARKLSAVRQFHHFLLGEGVATRDPTQTVSSPKRAMPLPKVLSVAEVDRLLEAAREAAVAAKGPAKVRLARMHCLVELLYATGLRVSELVSLTVRTVKADTRVLTIKGKGGRERLVPLNLSAGEALKIWLKLRPEPA